MGYQLFARLSKFQAMCGDECRIALLDVVGNARVTACRFPRQADRDEKSFAPTGNNADFVSWNV